MVHHPPFVSLGLEKYKEVILQSWMDQLLWSLKTLMITLPFNLFYNNARILIYDSIFRFLYSCSIYYIFHDPLLDPAVI